MISVCCVLPNGIEEIHEFEAAPMIGDAIEIREESYIVRDRILSTSRKKGGYTILIGLIDTNDAEAHENFLRARHPAAANVECIFPDGSKGFRLFEVVPGMGDTLEIEGVSYSVEERILREDEELPITLYLDILGYASDEEETPK